MPNKDSSSLNNGCMHAHTEEEEKKPKQNKAIYIIYLIIYYTLCNFIKIQSIFTKEQQKQNKKTNKDSKEPSIRISWVIKCLGLWTPTRNNLNF